VRQAARGLLLRAAGFRFVDLGDSMMIIVPSWAARLWPTMLPRMYERFHDDHRFPSATLDVATRSLMVWKT
jgi:hypothetical protein